MKSKVIRLYDYTVAVIPEELRRWRVTEEEIDGELARLSAVHAREKEVETVQKRDSVVCSGKSTAARWNQPVLLFYPGYGLCEKVLEDALLGMCVGESKTVTTDEGDVKLTVLRILRGREPFPVCDELVKLEKLEGVDTVADYSRWFRRKIETERHGERSIPIAQYLMQEVMTKSEVSIDEDEEAKWTWDWVDHMLVNFDAKEIDWKARFGIDPTLTDEQARQQLFEEYRLGFRNCILHQAIIERAGLDVDAVRREGIAEIVEQEQKTIDEIIKSSGSSAVDMMILMKQAKHVIFNYAEQHLDEILED